MVDSLAERARDLAENIIITTQSLIGGRLFVIDNLCSRQLRGVAVTQSWQAKVQDVSLREIDEEIAMYHFLEPIPLGAGFFGGKFLAINPVWRIGKKAPSLPCEGHSGKIYKSSQGIPTWECRSSDY